MLPIPEGHADEGRPKSGANPLSDGKNALDLQSWKTLVADLLYLGASDAVPHNAWTCMPVASVAN